MTDQPSAQPAPPRRIEAWICLGALFFALISLQLMGIFMREKGSKPPSLASEEMSLRMTLSMRQLQDSLAQSSPYGESSREINKKSASKIYADAAEKLEAKPGTPAARLAAAYRQLAGEKPPAKTIATLEKSKEVTDQQAAAVWKGDKTPPVPVSEDASFSKRAVRAAAAEAAGEAGAMNHLVAPGSGLLAVGGALFALLAAGIGLIVVVAYWGGLKSGSVKPIGLPEKWMSLLDADRLAMRAVIGMALYVTVSTLMSFVRAQGLDQGASMAINGLVWTACVYASLSIPLYGVKDSVASVMGKDWSLGKLLMAPVANVANAFLILCSLVLVIPLSKVLPSPEHPATNMLSGPTTPMMVIGILVAAVVAAPLVEELVFRGLIFPAVTRATGKPWVGILISGFLFAAIHPQGPAGWPPLMTIGCVAAVLVYQTGSVWPAVLMHALHNGATVGLNYFINR